MKIIALYNIKGGVGKTAACVNLAHASAASGLKTLLWDLDAQGAASYYCNVKPEVPGGAKKLFKSREAAAQIRETDIEHLDMLPADFSYRHLDLFLDGEKKSKKRMGTFLEQFSDAYDVIFLDCPPSFSLLSENVFNAADVMLIPLIPTTLSMRTYEQIFEYSANHKKLSLRLMPFFSMVDNRKKLHQETIESGRATIPGLLHTSIPYLSVIEHMGIHRAPLGSFAPKSHAATLFGQLWTEIVLRAKLNSR